jgi:hypothetical protein
MSDNEFLVAVLGVAFFLQAGLTALLMWSRIRQLEKIAQQSTLY